MSRKSNAVNDMMLAEHLEFFMDDCVQPIMPALLSSYGSKAMIEWTNEWSIILPEPACAMDSDGKIVHHNLVSMPRSAHEQMILEEHEHRFTSTWNDILHRFHNLTERKGTTYTLLIFKVEQGDKPYWRAMLEVHTWFHQKMFAFSNVTDVLEALTQLRQVDDSVR